MTCIICEKPDKYKCPTCGSRYCSVPCFKTHKEKCSRSSTAAAETSHQTVTPAMPTASEFDSILKNERVQELLHYEGVDKHLGLVARILSDSKLSGEQSSEGRRAVALKKIRELRKGGREANAAIEELAVTVNQLYNGEES